MDRHRRAVLPVPGGCDPGPAAVPGPARTRSTTVRCTRTTSTSCCAWPTETEGAASAELVRYWAERQPQAFSVYRLVSTGRIVAFTARLALPAPPDPQDLATDPVVAAAWRYTGPPRR